MPCYHPITAFQAEPGTPLLFEQPQWAKTQRGGGYQQLQIACQQCSGCRLKRSREWAMRCLHEKQLHKNTCFITLTYNDDNLPEHNRLVYRDFQLFMKRLRKAAQQGMNQENSECRADRHQDKDGQPVTRIKFYMCGEYGEQLGRPHFHAILFGVDFTDRLYIKKTPSGSKLYRSERLERLWNKGFSSVADVTFESAAYVARYVMKKRTGDGNKTEYEILDLETGEIVKKKKEFNNMSRGNRQNKNNGIGRQWLEKYKDDVYTTGKVIVRGHKNNPPRYYDKLMKKIDQEHLEDMQYKRYLEALTQLEHRTPERLAVQEEVATAKTKSLKRKII